MPAASFSRRLRSLAGFTLIELLIVILIIGILVAIAVPAYLRYTASANDRDAQAALLTAYKAAVAGDTEVNTGKFPVASTVVADVKQDEPAASISSGDCYGAVANAPGKQVQVDPSSTSSQITMCVRSASGTIWRLTGPLAGTPTVADGSVVPFTFSGNEITDSSRAASANGDGLTNDSSTGVWEASTNLIKNSDLAVDLTYWAASNGSDGTGTSDGALQSLTDASLPVNGGRFVRYTISTIHAYAFFANQINGYWSGWPGGAAFDTTAQYTLSFWARDPNNSGQAFRVAIMDQTSTNIVMSGHNFTPTSTWQRFTFTFTPSIAGSAPDVFFGNNPYRGTFDVSGLQLEKLPYATPYMASSKASFGARSVARLQMPAGSLTTKQGWIAMRVRAGKPAPIPTGDSMRFFDWRGTTSSANVLAVSRDYNSPLAFFRGDTTNLASTNYGTASTVISPGDMLTMIAAWTPTQIGLSVNGSAFSWHSNTLTGQTNMPALIEIGGIASNSQRLDGDIMWLATGTGNLNDSDAATINGFGNTDPARSSFPSTAQPMLVWDGASTAGSLK